MDQIENSYIYSHGGKSGFIDFCQLGFFRLTLDFFRRTLKFQSRSKSVFPNARKYEHGLFERWLFGIC